MGLEDRARAAIAKEDAEVRARDAAAAPGLRKVGMKAHPDLADLHEMLKRIDPPTAPIHVELPSAEVRGRQTGFAWLADAWFISVWDGDVDSTPFPRAVITTSGEVFTSWRWEYVYRETKRASGRLQTRSTRGGHTPRIFVARDSDRLTADGVGNTYWRNFAEPLATDLLRHGRTIGADGFVTVTVPIGS